MSEPESVDQPLPLVTHLTELRDKLLRALLAPLYHRRLLCFWHATNPAGHHFSIYAGDSHVATV
jgi:hypothetical protein